MKALLAAGLCAVVSLSACVPASHAFVQRAESPASRAGLPQPGRHVVPSGEFEVEVLVRGTRLEDLYGRGRRYVEAIEGAEYALRIRNPLPVRVAVALSVDGLSTIDARRSSSWDASKWVIEPYQSILVEGWQVSTERARSFYFTTERDSYASKLGRTSDLGVITAVFYREARPTPILPPPPRRDVEPLRRSQGEDARPAAPSQPNSEMRSESGGATAAGRGKGAVTSRGDDDYAATGIGRERGNSVRWVNLNLERRPVAEVTLRYEYRDSLVRLGILPRHATNDNALRRRERARGFEDPRFCPEP